MENNNNRIIPINNSLASFERQIEIGEKLLGIKLSDLEKEKIKIFLIETVSNNYDIIKIISSYFPLTEKLIDKFKDKLNWTSLCYNNYIDWNDRLIDKYLEFIDWSSCCNYYLGWNERLIDKYLEFIDWESLSKNSNINWNEKLLYKYIDSLDFNSVFEYSDHLKLTFNLYVKFKDKIDPKILNDIDFNLPKELIKENIEVLEWKEFTPYTEDIVELFKETINWDELSKSETLELTDELIEKYKHKWTWHEIIKIERKNGIPTYIRIFYFYYSDGTASNIVYNLNTSIDEELLDCINNKFIWPHFSRDIDFNNNHLLIDKYINKWDWELLMYNKSITWTVELIEKYKNKIDWKVFSLNPNLVWSEEVIDKFYDYWDWKTLGMNSCLPWTLAFYKKYENKFQKEYLFFQQELEFDKDYFYESNHTLVSYFVEHHFNKKITQQNFDINLIFYVKDILDWAQFSGNYEWSKDEIEKYKDYMNWRQLSFNRNINWSIELLKKYEDKWDWELIGKNKLVIDFDLSLLTKYVNYITENENFSYRHAFIKIRTLFLKLINEGDVIDILEQHQEVKTKLK